MASEALTAKAHSASTSRVSNIAGASRLSSCKTPKIWSSFQSGTPMVLRMLAPSRDSELKVSLGASALGLAWGCRILRVHDVKGTCRVRDALAAVSAAE